MKRSASLIAPALLLPLAAVIPLARTVPDPLAAAVHAAPLVVFGGGTLLGILTRRGRLVLGLMVLAVACAALIHFGSRTTYYAVAVLLPLNLGVIAFLGETNALTPRAGSQLGLVLLQAALVAIFQLVQPAAPGAPLERQILAASGGLWTALPRSAVLVFAAMLGVLVARFAIAGRPLAAGAAWALVAAFLALDAIGSGGPANVHFAAAGMLLAVGAVLEPTRVAHVDRVTRLPASLELAKEIRQLPHGYTLACVAVDEFRTFRDAHGADAGDRILRMVGRALARRVGVGARVFYVMREQAFVVVFRRGTVDTAVRRLDVVRRAVEALTLDVSVRVRPRPVEQPVGGPVDLPGPRAPERPAPRAVVRTVSVTVSAGVAAPQRFGDDPHEVLRDAQRALTRAQEAGMDRVVVQPRPGGPGGGTA